MDIQDVQDKRIQEKDFFFKIFAILPILNIHVRRFIEKYGVNSYQNWFS